MKQTGADQRECVHIKTQENFPAIIAFWCDNARLVRLYKSPPCDVNVLRLIDRLETAAIMRRESCPADGRCQIVRIKPTQRSLLKRMWPVYGAAIQHAIGDRLNDEETGLLVALLGKLYKIGHER